ncbi:hypothetical protein H5410_045234 [Solanum commersonii]|uniref:Uncharacterized protein n=1 Tax=Solanum commersonii TaxID=4109 RepID=A0A9J5XD39_SOLCO|nr:hypothetical protein H5410_045234 [Solanum commersonii]
MAEKSEKQAFINKEPEPINWEYYRKGIGSRLVDMYKEAYESMWNDIIKARDIDLTTSISHLSLGSTFTGQME